MAGLTNNDIAWALGHARRAADWERAARRYREKKRVESDTSASARPDKVESSNA